MNKNTCDHHNIIMMNIYDVIGEKKYFGFIRLTNTITK